MTGCGDSKAKSGSGHSKKAHSEASGQWSDELFTYAVNNLNRVEEFDAGEVLSQILQRMSTIEYAGRLPEHSDPLLTTWPEPEMLDQAVERLNQWVKLQSPPEKWQLDPLVASLPPSIQELPQAKDLDKMHFSTYDGFALVEAVWLRDVGKWAKGKSVDDLEQARRLFDWTVRNIQLDPSSPDHIPQVPWETLLLGRGTAMERAWVFILLLRQQGIDACVLGLPESSQIAGGEWPGYAGAYGDDDIRPWCVAVLSNDRDKNLYLFDTRLGLPIPAAKGLSIDRAGQLEVQPATLGQVIADRSLLDRLNYDEEHPYLAKSADLKRVVVMVEASPLYLSKSARALESHLAGAQRMVLSVQATAQGERLKAAAHAASFHLWSLPYWTLERRSMLSLKGIHRQLNRLLPLYALPMTPLYRGRILHLKGQFAEAHGAVECYQIANPTEREVAELRKKRVEEYEKMFASRIEDMPRDQQEQAGQNVKTKAQQLVNQEIGSCVRGKRDATYWLGLISFEQGNYSSAIDYFGKQVIEDSLRGPWTTGAQYNLGRSEEAAGQTQKAVEEYVSSVFSIGNYGNLLRARWLNDLLAAKEKAVAKEKAETKEKTEAKKPEGKDKPKAKSEPAAKDKPEDKGKTPKQPK
jgi:tetratricopeptide (TPR) repeat protein